MGTLFQKSYENVGYAPRDGGYLICSGCHDASFVHKHPAECDCGSVFAGSETQHVERCETCHEVIDTVVLSDDRD